LVKDVFFAVLSTKVSFEAINLGYVSWCQKTRVCRLLESENRMMLRSLVLSQYQRVTDERTGRLHRRTRHAHS